VASALWTEQRKIELTRAISSGDLEDSFRFRVPKSTTFFKIAALMAMTGSVLPALMPAIQKRDNKSDSGNLCTERAIACGVVACDLDRFRLSIARTST